MALFIVRSKSVAADGAPVTEITNFNTTNTTARMGRGFVKAYETKINYKVYYPVRSAEDPAIRAQMKIDGLLQTKEMIQVFLRVHMCYGGDMAATLAPGVVCVVPKTKLGGVVATSFVQPLQPYCQGRSEQDAPQTDGSFDIPSYCADDFDSLFILAADAALAANAGRRVLAEARPPTPMPPPPPPPPTPTPPPPPPTLAAAVSGVMCPGGKKASCCKAVSGRAHACSGFEDDFCCDGKLYCSTRPAGPIVNTELVRAPCLAEQCDDDPDYRDAKGFACSSWRTHMAANAYNCTDPPKEYTDLRAFDKNELLSACPWSCGVCRTWLEDGSWSDADEGAELIPCGSGYCGNGVCVEGATESRCNCDTGWGGISCMTRVYSFYSPSPPPTPEPEPEPGMLHSTPTT
jgi:hypothetical protein